MTNLIDKIKEDSLAARKARLPTASFMIALLGEAQVPGKNNGNRASTNEEVIKVLTRFKTGLEETVSFAFNDERYVGLHAKALTELTIVNSYLPEMLGEEQIKTVVHSLFDNGIVAIGFIMKHFKDTYPGQYDGKYVSSYVAAYNKNLTES